MRRQASFVRAVQWGVVPSAGRLAAGPAERGRFSARLAQAPRAPSVPESGGAYTTERNRSGDAATAPAPRSEAETGTQRTRSSRSAGLRNASYSVLLRTASQRASS